MKLRILTTIVVLPIIMFLIYYGSWPLLLTLCVASIIGIYEFYKAINLEDSILKYGTGLFVIMIYINYYIKNQDFGHILLIFFIFFVLATYVMEFPKISLEQLAYTAFTSGYIIYLLMHIAFVRNDVTYGKWFVWLIFVIAFCSDSGAYFAGVNLGKRKLAPKLSPNKTIEGAIGGILGAGFASLIFGYIMYSFGPISELSQVPVFFLIGSIGSLVSQMGDLVGSAMKRQTGIKDFGKIIPGHGGILDRMDSILVTAAYVYLAVSPFF